MYIKKEFQIYSYPCRKSDCRQDNSALQGFYARGRAECRLPCPLPGITSIFLLKHYFHLCIDEIIVIILAKISCTGLTVIPYKTQRGFKP